MIFLFLTAGAQAAPQSVTYGSFEGTLKLQPTGDGVHMKVLERYSYTDAESHTLAADPGFSTDGASIPRALWTVVGSPFTGKYIGAAVIHDVGCDTHKYSWQITHRMFYDAMRSLGVSQNYALLLYWGVRVGGPKWVSRVIEGTSPEEVKQHVQGATGKQLDNSQIQQLHPRLWGAIVEIPLPQGQTLSDKEVEDFNRQIQDRAASKGLPMSVDEIDELTPLNTNTINNLPGRAP
jgi:hypothetical protein